MQSALDALWERLLEGGVGRRPARRYLAELQDHLDDLIAEERRVASGLRDAELRAEARLGSVEALAGAMISRREFRALSSKAPIATYLIAPSAALVLCVALAMAGVVLTATWLRGAAGTPSDLPAWSKSFAAGVVFFANTMLPVLLGWALGATAIRQRSSLFWPVLGLVLLAIVGAAVQVGVTLPSATGHGEIEFSSGFGSLPRWVGYAGRLILNLTLTLTPYVALTMWRGSQAGSDRTSASPT
jgi:hypothetical protein